MKSDGQNRLEWRQTESRWGNRGITVVGDGAKAAETDGGTPTGQVVKVGNFRRIFPKWTGAAVRTGAGPEGVGRMVILNPPFPRQAGIPGPTRPRALVGATEPDDRASWNKCPFSPVGGHLLVWKIV